jgi:hypothetical protein
MITRAGFAQDLDRSPRRRDGCALPLFGILLGLRSRPHDARELEARDACGAEDRAERLGPRIGAVEPSDPRRRDDRGLHQARVDAHAIERRIKRQPVRDAAAGRAVMEIERLVAPPVGHRRAGDPDPGRRVVRPQRAGPAADRAVAGRELERSGVHRDRDRGDRMRRPCARTVPQRRPKLGRRIAVQREPELANGNPSTGAPRWRTRPNSPGRRRQRTGSGVASSRRPAFSDR